MYTVLLYNDDLIVTKKIQNYKYHLFSYKKMHHLTFEGREEYTDIDYRTALKSCACYILDLITEAKSIVTYTNEKFDYFEVVLSDCSFIHTIDYPDLKKVTFKLQRFIEEYEEYIRCYFHCISSLQDERAQVANEKGKKIISKIKIYQNEYLQLVESYIRSLPCRHSFANLENQESSKKIRTIFSQYLNLRHDATESLVKIDILMSIAKDKMKALSTKDINLLIALESREKSYFQENSFFKEDDSIVDNQTIISHFQIPSIVLGLRSDEKEDDKSEVVIKPLCYGCIHNLSDVQSHTGLCRVTCETCLQKTHRKHSGQCLPKNNKVDKTVNRLLADYDIKELSKYFAADIKVKVDDNECRFNKIPEDLFFILSFFLDKPIILND